MRGASGGQQQVIRYFKVGDREYRITIPVEVKLTHTPQSKGGTVTAVVSGREKWTVEEVTG